MCKNVLCTRKKLWLFGESPQTKTDFITLNNFFLQEVIAKIRHDSIVDRSVIGDYISDLVQ